MFRRAAWALILLALSACATVKQEPPKSPPRMTAKNPCYPRPMMFKPCLPIVEGR